VPTCKIQWVDEKGRPTPDQFPAIGQVYRVAYDEELNGRRVHFEESERFPICSRHYEQLFKPGMQHWRFEPFASADAAQGATP